MTSCCYHHKKQHTSGSCPISTGSFLWSRIRIVSRDLLTRRRRRRRCRRRKLGLESSHARVAAEVADRSVAHRQMVLRRAVLVALVTRHRLSAVGLEVDAEQRETVQGAEQLHRAAAVDPLHHVEVAAHRAAPLAADVALVLRTERRHARRAAELVALPAELHHVCRQDVRRRHLTAPAALVGQDAVVVAELGKASLAAELVTDPAHHHLVQRRRGFGAYGARCISRTAHTRLTLLAAVCNCLLGKAAGFPGRNNHATLIFNSLRTVCTGCNRLLERIQAILQNTHHKHRLPYLFSTML